MCKNIHNGQMNCVIIIMSRKNIREFVMFLKVVVYRLI